MLRRQLISLNLQVYITNYGSVKQCVSAPHRLTPNCNNAAYALKLSEESSLRHPALEKILSKERIKCANIY